MKNFIQTILLGLAFTTAAHAQSIVNSGAEIVNSAGSYWVVDNGAVTLSSTNMLVFANLSITDDASLTVPSSLAVTVNGTLTNNAGDGGLTLQSSAASSASLIHNNANVAGTVEHYLANNQWYIIGSSVDGQDINGFLSDANNSIAYKAGNGGFYGVTTYNETTNLWDDYLTASAVGSFANGTGYLVRRQATDGSVSFGGTLSADNVLVGVSRLGKGWNGVSNPYPCAIGVNSDAVTPKNFLTQNTGVLDDNYEALYVSDPTSDDYIIVSQAAFSNTTGKEQWLTSYFQSGQGFIVRSSGSENVVFDTDMRIHQPDLILKSGRKEWSGVVLAAAIKGATSKTGITFHEGMTNGLDAGYDAGAFKAKGAVSVFTQLAENNGVDFGLQCLPESAAEGTVLAVGLETSTGGEVTFSLEKVLFSPFTKVSLEDRTMGTTTNFDSPSDAYTALIEKGSPAYGRFYLTFGETTGNSAMNNIGLNAWFSNGNIIVNGELSTKAKMALYDIRGRKIREINSQEINSRSFEVSSLISGVYLLDILDGGRHASIKIPIIKNN